MCFGSLISISVAQQLDLTAILKLQTSETSVSVLQSTAGTKTGDPLQ